MQRARGTKSPLVMGVLNVTPDSFSDGGQHTSEAAWRARIDQLCREGADVIDIGGESTRPGAAPVADDEQLRRVLPPIAYAASQGAVVSIDTTSPLVASHALSAGASIINDVSCLADRALATVAAEHAAHLIVMHSLGPMSDMRGFSTFPDDAYADVVESVEHALRQAAHRAADAGLDRSRLLFDPGLGFHKNARHSYALMRALPRLSALGPLVVGASRKSFLARDVPAPPDARLGGSLAAALVAASAGATMVRVHDVLATRQALAVTAACEKGA